MRATRSSRSPLVPLLLVALGALLPLRAVAAADDPARPPFELVETWPVETELDDPELRDAHEVWLERIARAERSIDLGQFYASNREGSRLEAVVQALEAAPARGVRVPVRFLASEAFRATYPDTLERLDARATVDPAARYEPPVIDGE